MFNYKTIYLVLFGFSMFASTIASQAENYKAPKSKVFPQLNVPMMLRHLNLIEPSATAIVRVGAEGKILGHIFIKADHIDLLPVAEKGLQRAEFEPAQLEGESVVGDLKMEIHFANPRKQFDQTAQMSIGDHIQENIQRLSKTEKALTTSLPQELDQPLSILDQGKSIVPVDKSDNPIKGDVLYEFYIDPEGIPQLPKVISSDGPAFSKAALFQIESMKFEPPLRDGKPTVVKVRLPFNYKYVEAK